jgi:hypothetical protein
VASGKPVGADHEQEELMLWLVLLALLIAVVFGLGFVVKWLFVLAAILALVWVIAFFTGGARARA